MSFSFRCPKCNTKLEAENEWIGREATCPTCNESIIISQEPHLRKAPCQDQESDDDNKYAGKRSSRKLNPVILSLIIVGIIVLLFYILIVQFVKPSQHTKRGSGYSNQTQSRQYSTNSYKEKIIYVLEQDRKCHADTPQEQFQAMCMISLAGCPVDFCEAYNRHKAAWSNAANLISECEEYVKKANSDEAVAVGFLEGFLGGLGGDPTYGYRQAQDRYNKAEQYFKQRGAEVQAGIRETYNECLQIANKYGVDVGKYY